jgi:hypothetical protein
MYENRIMKPIIIVIKGGRRLKRLREGGWRCVSQVVALSSNSNPTERKRMDMIKVH